jgi:xanthine dehydrogenase YagT iron-sulfur-binding subunit
LGFRLQRICSNLCRCTGYVRYYEAVREVILAAPGLVRG